MVYNRTEKARAKQERRRKKILKAAKEILAEDSAGGASIKSIAHRAGIATGTLYLYFTDKENLIETVIKEMYAELLDMIKKERAQYTDLFDKLQTSMEVCMKIFMKEKHLAKVLLEHFPELHTESNSKFTDLENDLIRLVKQDLDELLQEKRIPNQDTQVSATAFVGTFRQVILSWIHHEEPEDLEEAYKTLIQYNLRGLGRVNSELDYHSTLK